MLITAGPTHEPIDAVRYIGNRSSGRLGIAVAEEAARRGWPTTLLLGPTALAPSDGRVTLRRFQSASDLEALLRQEMPLCDVLVMAAAVADYRPRAVPDALKGKWRRITSGMTLELEPTPDLVARCAADRRPGQFIVGFALEPRAELLASARDKLSRKGIDLIVANPLETMDSPAIEATVIGADGLEAHTEGRIDKREFAPWLLDLIMSARRGAPATNGGGRS